jgi:hypothetical protein
MTSRASPSSSRGIALLATLLAMSVVGALALSLSLTGSVDRLVSANVEEAQALLAAADAGLELAARELSLVANWDAVLDGSVVSAFVDGPPGARTPLPGVALDLVSLTNALTCGDAGVCPDAARRVSTRERPWGDNNPRWQPFLHVSAMFLIDPKHPSAPYVVVWVGDDSREVDGNVSIDGGGAGGEGRYIVRARSEAFGPRGGRRAIDAEFARVCQPAGAGVACRPGVRVQGWRLGSGAVP